MATKKVIVKSIELRSGVVLAILFLLTLLFCPWMWKPLPDGYFPYAGQVIDKGIEYHLFFTGENHWDKYIIVEGSDGTKKKKYVGDYEYAIVQKGTFVVKKKGFGNIPLRPDEIDPRDFLRRFQKQ